MISARPLPEWERAALLAGGVSPNGKPRLRIVWSDSRTELVGGHWEWTDEGHEGLAAVGIRRVEKYPAIVERWILEAWYPPSFYGSPEEWAEKQHLWVNGASTECLAGYPDQGDYEHLWTFEVGGRFVEPTLEAIRWLGQLAPRMREASVRQRGERRRAHHRKKELDHDRVMGDRIEDQFSPFLGTPWVSMAGAGGTQ